MHPETTRRGEPVLLHVLLDMRVEAGGVGRYASDLLEGFAAHPEVDCVPFPDPPDRRPFAAAPFTPWGRWAAARAAARTEADLIHCSHLETLPTRRLQVVTIHDVIPLAHPVSMPNPLRRAVFRATLKRSFARAAAIVTPSEHTAATLRAYGAPADHLNVVPHGVSERFRPASEEERHAARARFAGGSPYVAAILSPRPHKNCGVLSEVGELLAPDVVVVGAGRHPSSPVRSVGPLSDEDLVSFYAGAEVSVLPSLLEGFGLPILESLACGVPVVCGPELGALEFLSAGTVLTDVRRAASIAESVRQLIVDPARRSELSTAGLEAAAIMSLERMASATVAVYRRALSLEG